MAYAPVGEVIPSDIPGAMAMGLRQPVGVVGAIAPWNAALILSLRSITAPLVLGNTVVLKPSEWSPISGGLIWGEIFAEAGLPAGVLNIVTHAPGEAGAIGDELVESPLVRRLNFTGSTNTGRRLAEAAGRQPQADRPRARRLQPADRARRRRPRLRRGRGGLRQLPPPGADLHVGAQDHRRALRSRTTFTDRLVAKTASLKVGDPKEHDTIIGPLINQQALSTVAARVQDAVDRGAKVLTGGEPDGPCYKPTLVTDVPADAPFSCEETFGPVASIETVGSADEAVARANATGFGLSAGIITGDLDRGMALARQIESGIVHVNDQTVGDEPQMPFGGVKDSGWGRFGGRAAMEEFTELRWVTVQSGTRHFPF